MTARTEPPSIPGWEILGHVGAGGMADVWKARRADGTVAAVKVVRPVKRLSAGEVASFYRREALASLNVDHPNVVRALDAGTTADGRPYLALDFVEGRTLHAVIADGGPVPEARVVEIGLALASALDHVHRRGLVHRDVGPRNVMLAAGGGVKLLDLGLVVEAADGVGEHTLGTYGFVAPEVASRETAGPRSDFFSLGATLAAAATGRMPGRERSLADTALPAAVGGTPLSPGFRQVVARLLKRDPAGRYASAAEIVLDLQSVAAGDRPLGAILGAAGARVVRRGPRIAAWTAGLCAAAAGAWWLASRDGGTPESGDATAPAAAARPAPRDPKLDAAAVFLETFPDDFVRGHALIDEADTPALTDAERAELARLREECGRRTAAAAGREFEARGRLLTAAIAAGDVPLARRIAAEWPDSLRGSAFAQQLAETAAGAAKRRSDENRALAEDADRVVRSPTRDAAEVDALVARIDAALARPEYDGDGRGPLAAVRPRLGEIRGAALAARATAEAQSQWRAAVSAFVAAPSSERLRGALDAAAAPAMPESSRTDAAAFVAARARAEPRLKSRTAWLKGKSWCGPRGAALACDVVDVPPTADDVFLSPLWAVSGGRAEAVVAAAKGADEAAAWLFARGLWDDGVAASGPEGVVARWLADVERSAPSARAEAAWPAGFDVGLALRDPGSRAPPRSGGDPVVAAWSAAVDAVPRPASRPAANPDKAAGRDAFVAGELGKAVQALTKAALGDPGDGEIAALRGRAFLVASRELPTAPAVLAAFSEGRRSWDLDPKLPAGPVLAADAGIAFRDLAGGEVAARVRTVAAAACEAADALGRADARMLVFAGEFHIDAGRAAEAAALLRRAVALAPDSAPAALLLARAEHASGHDDRAREALRRARDLLGGTLPAPAAALARTIGL